MKSRTYTLKCVWALALLGAPMCVATTPAPDAAQCSLIDRVGAVASAGLPTGLVALEILERVAEGRMETVSRDLELKIGLEAGQLHTPDFRYYTIRSCALRKIGQLDMPQALTYLQNLQKKEIDPDTSGQVWSSAEIALHEAEFNHISDEPTKIHFLERTTGERSAAAWWAVQELCNRGSYPSLPFITAQVKRAYSLPSDVDHAIGFCEARMGIISRDPDRVRALGSFLSVRSGVTDPELLGWAINELRAIKSPRAESEVQRFADEIEGLPDDSSLKNALWGKRVQIRGMGPDRRK